METRQVQAGKDTILSLADRANPVDAVAELIWNSLDAEATRVEVTVSVGALGAPEEIAVKDDGHGIPYAQAVDVFTIHGESWKKQQRFSAQIQRPLHGQLGRGRFLTYTLGERVRWQTVTTTGEGTSIRGMRTTPNRYEFDGPSPTTEHRGTKVTIQARQDQRVARLVDEEFPLALIARLAPSLLALTDVHVLYRGAELDPRLHIVDESHVELELDNETLAGREAPQLVVVEWARDMKARNVFLCDEHGSVVTDYKPQRLPPVPIHWTAYIRWSGFGDPDLMGLADLHNPDVRHGVLVAAADRALADYLNRRLDERRGHLIPEWKAEGVYPYHGDPAGPAEEIERELFDVVAVVASPAVGKDTRQKKLSLRLLQEAVRSEPGRTRKILNAVLELSVEEQEVLVELLERTALGAIVRAVQTVGDRIDFLRGLERLLFSDETRRTFTEVDQLHPMLVNEPWIFGDEWTLTATETGLTAVVRSAVAELGPDAEVVSHPVKQPSGKSGRVDLVFHRELVESERSRHLVVELKRPMKLTMTEYGQLNNYATAITSHPQVPAMHVWDFWLVGTDVDSAVRNLDRDPSRPGLVAVTDRYRLWIATWSELIERARKRLEVFRLQLDLSSTEESARAYLNRVHREFVPTEAPSA